MIEPQPPNVPLPPRSPDSAGHLQVGPESVIAPEPVTLTQLHRRVSDLALKTGGGDINGNDFSFKFIGEKKAPDQEVFDIVDVHIQDLSKMQSGMNLGGTYAAPKLVEIYGISSDGIIPRNIRVLPSTNPEIAQAARANEKVDSETEKLLTQRLSEFLDGQDVHPNEPGLAAVALRKLRRKLRGFREEVVNKSE